MKHPGVRQPAARKIRPAATSWRIRPRAAAPFLALLLILAACTDPTTTPPPGSNVRPAVTGSEPADGDTTVFRDAVIRAFYDAEAALDESTVNDQSVTLTRSHDGATVSTLVQVDAANEAIVVLPEGPLDPQTEYRLAVTDAAEDVNGSRFVGYSASFTTGVQFEFPEGRSYITRSTPCCGAQDVHLDTAVTTVLNPGGVGVDRTSASPDTVQLYRTSDGTSVDGTVTVSGADDSVTYQPFDHLEPNTTYTFEVTDGLMDKNGLPFIPYSTTFTTGTELRTPPADVDFEAEVVLDEGAPVTSLVIGPDGMLYGTALDGILRRWPIETDGTLGATESLTAFPGRPMIGIAFDPGNDDAIWVTHNAPVPQQRDDGSFMGAADDFSGALARITLNEGSFTGATIETLVEGFPRSIGDHMTNSLAFGPDGALYVTQGSNTGAGAPDSYWGFRPERLLTAAVLRIDTDALSSNEVLDVQTEAVDGSPGDYYDPTAPDAPVTIFATGLRNAYDLVFHSNGHLYVPTNGGNGFGSAPASPPGADPSWPLLEDLDTQPDFLFDVTQGGYYGHPNVSREEYVLNGGNPTAGPDPAEVAPSDGFDGYPVGTNPPENYGGFAYQFVNNASANGAIEYTSDAFGGTLQNQLLVTIYANGGFIQALEFDESGDVIGATNVMGGFDGPLDLVEDPNGNLYVAELRQWSNARIQLLRVVNE